VHFSNQQLYSIGEGDWTCQLAKVRAGQTCENAELVQVCCCQEHMLIHREVQLQVLQAAEPQERIQ
jgi:hypothetical protein